MPHKNSSKYAALPRGVWQFALNTVLAVFAAFFASVFYWAPLMMFLVNGITFVSCFLLFCCTFYFTKWRYKKIVRHATFFVMIFDLVFFQFVMAIVSAL